MRSVVRVHLSPGAFGTKDVSNAEIAFETKDVSKAVLKIASHFSRLSYLENRISNDKTSTFAKQTLKDIRGQSF